MWVIYASPLFEKCNAVCGICGIMQEEVVEYMPAFLQHVRFGIA